MVRGGRDVASTFDGHHKAMGWSLLHGVFVRADVSVRF